jgi:hypothetical protein
MVEGFCNAHGLNAVAMTWGHRRRRLPFLHIVAVS